uniref:Sphingosine kinase putative n=1 Tax=Albugo laibachii Nc14 TaxID=890382 RepID=F0WBK5_9STRA|nr:sphingosine kinase putative [Albugo laibachii Nc14]|eukprot:CCA18532.1 sphingosine kinase putative [Albugo laibachii Nc14]
MEQVQWKSTSSFFLNAAPSDCSALMCCNPMRYIAQFSIASECLQLSIYYNSNRKSKNATLLPTDMNHLKIREHTQVKWSDVIGAELTTNTAPYQILSPSTLLTSAVSTDTMYGIQVTMAIRTGQAHAKRRIRKWKCHFFIRDIQQVVTCAQYINAYADPRFGIPSIDTDLSSINTILSPRKFLVIVNPASGQKKASGMYHNAVESLFAAGGILIDLVITEKQGEATELARNMQLGKYDCVVIVSGDGLIHEFFQGLQEREDCTDAIKQPLGVIPGGTGNGLCVSNCFRGNESFDAIGAAYIVVKGKASPLDLTMYQSLQDQKKYCSFLSLEWAFIADLDIDSENLRALGPLRYTVKFVQMYFFTKKKYSGTIWYLAEDPEHCDTSELDLSLFDNVTLEPLNAPSCANEMVYHEKKTGNGVWKAIRGEFHLTWINNVSHPSSDSFAVPGAKFDDGYAHILLIKGCVQRSELLKVMLAIENGTHIQSAGVEIIKTRAFQVVSDAQDKFCVDGELVPGTAFRGQVHRGVARVVSIM